MTRVQGGKTRLEYPFGTDLRGGRHLYGPRVSPDGENVAFFEASRESGPCRRSIGWGEESAGKAGRRLRRLWIARLAPRGRGNLVQRHRRDGRWPACLPSRCPGSGARSCGRPSGSFSSTFPGTGGSSFSTRSIEKNFFSASPGNGGNGTSAGWTIRDWWICQRRLGRAPDGSWLGGRAGASRSCARPTGRRPFVCGTVTRSRCRPTENGRCVAAEAGRRSEGAIAGSDGAGQPERIDVGDLEVVGAAWLRTEADIPARLPGGRAPRGYVIDGAGGTPCPSGRRLAGGGGGLSIEGRLGGFSPHGWFATMKGPDEQWRIHPLDGGAPSPIRGLEPGLVSAPRAAARRPRRSFRAHPGENHRLDLATGAGPHGRISRQPTRSG